MLHKFKGKVLRKVEETYSIEIEASDPDEAKDLVYEILSTYPNSDFVANRLLCTAKEVQPGSIIIDLEPVGYPTTTANDVEEFDDGPGPEYA